MKYFFDMKLSYKFSLAILTAFISIAILALSFNSLIKSKQELLEINDKAHQIDTLMNQVKNHLSDAGRNEKEFLVNLSLEYADDAKNSMAEISRHLNELKSISIKLINPVLIDDLGNSVNEYATNFNQLVENRTHAGLDHNSGMNGKLRAAVHDVEDLLKQKYELTLSHSMLMMRRHEKDYLMRKLDKYIEKIQNERKRFDSLLGQSQLTETDKRLISQKMDVYIKTFLQLPPLDKDAADLIEKLNRNTATVVEKISELNKVKRDFLTQSVAQAQKKSDDITRNFFLTILASGVIIITLLVTLARNITRSMKNATTIADSIATGYLDNTIIAHSSDEIGQLMKSLELMQANLKERIEKELLSSSVNARITQALDNVSGNVMVADADGNIIYMNKAITEMMQNIEPDMRAVIPDFDPATLFGSNIDQFHKNPAHQRGILKDVKESYIADVRIGSRRMQIIANPVYDDNNEHLGTVAEWFDRTQQLAIQEEIQDIVNSAQAGDLSRRIDLSGKEGCFGQLSRDVNKLVDVSERAINDTVDVISAMAHGDLTHTIDAEYQGAFGRLKEDVNTTIARLTEVMAEITSSAHLVLNGSREIAEGNTNLSQRTEEQAASLEQTASSMQEMITTVRQNADNAEHANQLAVSARQQAEQGGNVVGEAVSAMSEITECSNKIAAITSVIDEIAFQTNLLALNAAVEAARAGEQGRGFAVVASEVRNLAGRSATAAKEIKHLIEDSVLKVEEGSKLVDASGQTLEAIMTSVKKVSDIIAGIAGASQEQTEGIVQVNHAISQMDEMTHQNAALVEQASAASESMGEQAKNLNDLVDFFKTKKNGATEIIAERRKADRPWNGGSVETTKPTKSINQPKKVKAVMNSSDKDEWEEF